MKWIPSASSTEKTWTMFGWSSAARALALGVAPRVRGFAGPTPDEAPEGKVGVISVAAEHRRPSATEDRLHCLEASFADERLEVAHALDPPLGHDDPTRVDPVAQDASERLRRERLPSLRQQAQRRDFLEYVSVREAAGGHPLEGQLDERRAFGVWHQAWSPNSLADRLLIPERRLVGPAPLGQGSLHARDRAGSPLVVVELSDHSQHVLNELTRCAVVESLASGPKSNAQLVER